MILACMNAIYAIAYLEAWKSQDFNRVWTRDFAIVVRRPNVNYQYVNYQWVWMMKWYMK